MVWLLGLYGSITTAYHADKVGVQDLNFVIVRTTVADDGQLIALLDTLLGYQFLKLLLCASLFRKHSVDVNGTRLVLKVEVTILVAVLQVLDCTRELVPHVVALGSSIEGGNCHRLHLARLRIGSLTTAIAIDDNLFKLGITTNSENNLISFSCPNLSF